MKRFVMAILCFCFSLGPILAQTQNVMGLVVDETGEPMIGVTVSVKGTSSGTMTDIDGRFNMTVPANVTSLNFSYVGYESQDVTISRNMKVAMTLASRELGEVVVTGMTSMDRRLFTGSTDRLEADKVKLDGLAEISRGLEGRSAGVTVQNVSGTFGAAPKIRVRGATSIYGDSKPLWVVDGVIMEDIVEVSADDLSSGDAATLISSAIAGLNASDIESFQILKDGSATSIYGARAMGGVIVITTKKGIPGQTRVNYTGEYTMRLKPNYADFNIMNSQEQMGIYKEMQEKGWLNMNNVFRASESGVYGKMYQLINDGLLPNMPEYKNEYLRNAEMRNTDWFGELFNTNVMHNHSVSISSGTDKTRFYASLSALVDPGWTAQSSVKRYTANLNVTHNILPNLSINLISNTSYRKQHAPGTLNQSIDAVRGEVSRDFDINPYSYALNTSRALDANETYTRNYAPFNILHELENNNMEFNVADMRFQGEISWKAIPELDIRLLAAVKYSTTSQEHRVKDESNQATAYRMMPDATIRDNNKFLYRDPDLPFSLPISILPEGGIYRRTDYKLTGYDMRLSGTWSKTLDSKHTTWFYGGMELNSADRQKTWFNGWGLQYSMGEIPFYVYQFFKQSVERNTTYFTMENAHTRQAAYFAQGIYSFDQKYTLSATGRYDGSNKLGRSSSARWLPTWNVSGSWDAHEEKFFESLKPTLSHLRLSVRYSLVGDLPPGLVANSKVLIESYKPFRYFSNAQESGLRVGSLENEDLTYEKKHEFNIGADIGFLNNRLNANVEWYKRNNYDLIGVVANQGVGGEIQKYANAAEMKSWGLEFTLSSKNIVTKDFNWGTDFIIAYNKTEVTKLENYARVMDLISGYGFALPGYPHRAIFSIPFQGLNEDGIPTFLNEKGEITTSAIYFQEREKIDFLKYEGPAEPTTTGSLQNSFQYKNFRLNVFVTYAFGNKIRLDPVFRSGYSDLASMPKEYKNRWVLPGDENYTTIPVILSRRQVAEMSNIAYAYNAYNYSTERIADGGFVRLKEVSLSYDLPQKWLVKPLNNVSLKLQATNLFLLYADKKLNGQDPEFFRSGGVSAPVPRQFTFTLRLGL
jgi:TonB-linked SusC/RagA family outer membrane protein